MACRKKREKAEDKERKLIERFEERILDFLKAYGPQPWDDLIVVLDPGRTGYAKLALESLKRRKNVRADKLGTVSLV
jgi:hypothetical protein